MRKSVVDNGVTFLTHPKVKDSPIDECITFLRGKGLTEEEINEAVRIAKATNAKSAIGTDQKNATTRDNDGHNNLPPGNTVYDQAASSTKRKPTWAERYLIPGTLALSAGAGLTFLYKTMILKQLPPQWFPPDMPYFGNWAASDNASFPGNQGSQPFSATQQMKLQDQSPSSAFEGNDALPGAPGAKNALIAQGKPVPHSAEFDFNSVKSETQAGSSLFGKAPYATSSLVMNNTMGSKNETNSPNAIVDYGAELLSASQQQCEVLRKISSTLSRLSEGVEGLQNVSRSPIKSDSDWKESLSRTQDELRSELDKIKDLMATNGILGKQNDDKIGKATCIDASCDNTKQLESETDGNVEAESESSTCSDPDPDELRRKHIENSRTVLAKLVEICPKSKLEQVSKTLLMYLRNLADNPQVPRYGRIARSNPNFKSLLGDVEYHLEFLKANGFEESSGGTMAISRSQLLEWSDTWRNNADAWSISVLRDSIANLEKVVSTEKTPLESKNHESLDNSSTSIAEVKALVPHSHSKENVADVQAEALLNTPTTTSSKQASPTHVVDENSRESLSYSEIISMVQAGKSPPGIKTIPNILSADAEKSSVATMRPHAKPWEASNTDSNSFSPATDFETPVNSLSASKPPQKSLNASNVVENLSFDGSLTPASD